MHGMSNQRNLENNKKRNNKDRSEWGHLSVHMLHRELKVKGGGGMLMMRASPILFTN